MFRSNQTLILFSIFSLASVWAQSCNPNIQWTRCPASGRNCAACFRVDFNNAARERDTMCLRSQGNCIFTGNLIGDGSFAVATASDLRNCRPFSNDALEFSLSSAKCSGGFILKNGRVQRPPPAFQEGQFTDIVLEVPEQINNGPRRPGPPRSQGRPINFA